MELLEIKIETDAATQTTTATAQIVFLSYAPSKGEIAERLRELAEDLEVQEQNDAFALELAEDAELYAQEQELAVIAAKGASSQ